MGRQAERERREAAQEKFRSESSSSAGKIDKQAIVKKPLQKPRWSDIMSEEHSDAGTESTAAASTVWEQDEVKRMASMDKEVRKLAKKLRDIEKLEKLEKLDVLQQKSLDRKAEVAI